MLSLINDSRGTAALARAEGAVVFLAAVHLAHQAEHVLRAPRLVAVEPGAELAHGVEALVEVVVGLEGDPQ